MEGLYNEEDTNVSLSGLKGMILCSAETLKVKEEKDLKNDLNVADIVIERK